MEEKSTVRRRDAGDYVLGISEFRRDQCDMRTVSPPKYLVVEVVRMPPYMSSIKICPVSKKLILKVGLAPVQVSIFLLEIKIFLCNFNCNSIK